jgi:hypothetical protein
MRPLSEIEAALPKWIYLTRNIGKFREGDEFMLLHIYGMTGCDIKWEKTREIGCPIAFMNAARRPIPPEVLESQAFWVMYNRLATIAPNEKGYALTIDTDPSEKWMPASMHCHYGDTSIRGQRKFMLPELLRESILQLGGEQNIIKHLSAGDLYSKWLSEQIQ